jgi:UDP-N-acetylmuramoyl-tripeptide--D-alanyl-D-alanine ligase
MINTHLSRVAYVLNAQQLGCDLYFRGCGIDSRENLTDKLFIALRGKNFDGHDFKAQALQNGAVALLVSTPQEINLPQLIVSDTRMALGQLAKFWRQQFTYPTIAVTGSNGKTTTKEMLKAIFSIKGQVLATKGNLNNDIGLPLTLLELDEYHDSIILEMGANHAGEIAYLTQIAQPNVALITQCAPAHLSGFKTIEGIAQAKGEIFSGLSSTGTAVINYDDNFAAYWRELAASNQIIQFGFNKSADVYAENIILAHGYTEFDLVCFNGKIRIKLPLSGRHNIANALAAASCALASNMQLDDIQQGLQSMSAVEGRLQIFTGLNHSTIINDTYNANPTSFKAALSVLQEYPAPRWLVMGDMGELGLESANLHGEIGEFANQVGVEQLWAVGDYSRYAVAAFGGIAQHFNSHEALLQELKTTLMQQPKVTILIKGSRSMTMEKITQALKIKDEHVTVA